MDNVGFEYESSYIAGFKDGVASAVKHGRWIMDKCSACNRRLGIGGGDRYGLFGQVVYEYCPHCGARMDGGTNNVD